MHIIVVGTEIGQVREIHDGHSFATALARQGCRVGTVNLDLRQLPLGCSFENKTAFVTTNGISLTMQEFVRLPEADTSSTTAHDARLDRAREGSTHFALTNCLGSHARLSQVVDTLVAPLNGSFVDLDLCARTEPGIGRVLGPSVYSEMVWRPRQMRRARRVPAIDWEAVRKPLGDQARRNKHPVRIAMERRAQRIEFRIAPRFADRVVFQALFPQGVTVLDLRDAELDRRRNPSHIFARQEYRAPVAHSLCPAQAQSFRSRRF